MKAHNRHGPINRNLQQPIIIRLDSRKSVEIESQLLFKDGYLNVFRSVEKQGLAFIQLRNNKATIFAGAFVGLIPITPDLQLDVRPKLPVINIARILAVAARRLTTLEEAGRRYEQEDLQTNPVLMFLAENLTRSVHVAAKQGFLKEYLERAEIGSTLRGRIQIRPTLIAQRVRAKPGSASTVQFHQTVDNIANRLIKHALGKAASTLLTAGSVARPSLKLINEALQLMPKCVGRLTRSDLNESSLKRLRILDARNYYEGAITYALLILREQGITLDEPDGEYELNGFIVNFETMFEDYTRNALRLKIGPGFQVEDGNSDARKPLFDDKKDPPAQPDIVVTKGRSRVIVEVKYKEKPDRNDINQAVTYALCYRTTSVILLHLTNNEALSGIHHVGDIQGISVYAFRYFLGSTVLETQEQELANQVTRLMGD